MGEFGGVPADERIGKQHAVVLVLVTRDAGSGMQLASANGTRSSSGCAPVAAHPGVSRRPRRTRQGASKAGSRVAAGAVVTGPAVQMGWNHYPSTGPNHAHRGADLLDHTERLVAERQARLGPDSPVIHMQVGAADRTVSDPDDDVCRVLDGSIGDLVHTDSPDVFGNDGLHQRLLTDERDETERAAWREHHDQQTERQQWRVLAGVSDQHIATAAPVSNPAKIAKLRHWIPPAAPVLLHER